MPRTHFPHNVIHLDEGGPDGPAAHHSRTPHAAVTAGDGLAAPQQRRGYTFVLDDAARLRRFLTLGAEGGTYYVRATALTRDNAGVVLRMAETDHRTLVDTIVDVSVRGAAPRVNPALFALAMAASIGADDERAYALAALPQVARTGTHLFLFAGYAEQFRGWGRGLRRAVAQWYLTRDVEATAYQAVKYRQREGWSHRDLLRLSHPVTADPARRALFEWIARGTTDAETPRLVEGFVKASMSGADLPGLVREYRLTWEMLPNEALTSASTWEALLDNGMAQTALMRQLPRLTRLGLLEPSAGRLEQVCAQLTDGDRLRQARVHPMSVLVALNTYSSGRSMAGSSTWAPVAQVVDALDAAFYASFGNVEASGRRTMLALDVSTSMTAGISGLPLSCREASAAMALVTAATEPATTTVGFTAADSANWRTAELTPLSISPRQRLDDALRAVSGLAFGGTDCALPMLHALRQKLPVDTFVVYTDNETWAGDIHPHQALRQYRERMGIDARLVVVGMTATSVSIADPDDAGMLDVAGFDPAVPSLIADFARG